MLTHSVETIPESDFLLDLLFPFGFAVVRVPDFDFRRFTLLLEFLNDFWILIAASFFKSACTSTPLEEVDASNFTFVENEESELSILVFIKLEAATTGTRFARDLLQSVFSLLRIIDAFFRIDCYLSRRGCVVILL